MLSKEDKLEMLQLIGEAINQRGGLSVQGTMIGEGGVQMVVQPVERAETTSRTEILEAVENKIGIIDAGLPNRYVSKDNYRYVFNQTVPLNDGIWKPADVNYKFTIAETIEKIHYLDATDEMYVLPHHDTKKLYIYDASSWALKQTVDLPEPIFDFRLSIDGERMIMQAYGNYGRNMYVYNKSFGIYIKVQEFDRADVLSSLSHAYNIRLNIRCGFVINSIGDAIYLSGRPDDYSSKFTVAKLSLHSGIFAYETASWSNITELDNGNTLWISPDNQYLIAYSTYGRDDNDYTGMAIFKYNKTTKIFDLYKHVHGGIVPRIYEYGHNITATLDLQRLFVSKAYADDVGTDTGKVEIWKETDDILTNKDPFSDGSLVIKYLFNNSLGNLVSNNYNLTLATGTETYDVDALLAGTLVLDGQTMYKIPNSTALETQDLSWTFNIKIDGPSTNPNYILANISTDSENKGRGIKLYEKDGKIVVAHGSGDGVWELVEDNTVITDNQYHSVAVTIADGGTIRIYIDGLLTKEQIVSPASISYNNTLSFISVGGYASNSANPDVYGAYHLNLLSYWNRALLSSEVPHIATQKLRQPGYYVLEQTIYEDNPTNNSYFGHGLTTNYATNQLWIASYANKAIYRYLAREAILLVDTFDVAAGWTLGASTTIQNSSLIMDHGTDDNEATHLLNQLDTLQYLITIEYAPYTGGDNTYKIKATIGDATIELPFNDQGHTTVQATVLVNDNKTIKLFTDADCKADVYTITKLTVANV